MMRQNCLLEQREGKTVIKEVLDLVRPVGDDRHWTPS